MSPAAIVTAPQVLAAAGIGSWSKAAIGDDAELQAVYELLAVKTEQVRRGDMARSRSTEAAHASACFRVSCVLV